MLKSKYSLSIALSAIMLGLLTGATSPKPVTIYSETVNAETLSVAEKVEEVENTIIVPIIEENIIEVEKEVINSPFDLKRIGTFTVKGYCNCDICKTVKSNPNAIRESEGINAIADLSIIPEGTMVWLDGVGIRQIQPSSRKTKGNYILVYFDNHEDVVNFGQKEQVAYKIMN